MSDSFVTVREARVQAARKAIWRVHNEGMEACFHASIVTALANAVVDALFIADPLIDNAAIPEHLVPGDQP